MMLSALRTSQLLPSIIRRIDDLLLVKELNAKLFNRAISDDMLLAAITAPAASVAFDYERLELLGMWLFIRLSIMSAESAGR